MKSLFPGSYPPSEDDFKVLWTEGMCVFDTNMLLNFYRYSDATRKEFLDLVSAPDVAPRIWIPYQVALEYHRNLDTVRHEQVAACHKMRNSIKEWSQSLKAGDHKRRAEQLLKLADDLVTDAENQYEHPDRKALIERIASLFEGKVGQRWDEKRLSEVYKEGEKRFRNQVPPGFKDRSNKSDDFDQYGDLVIWLQIIEEAQSRKKPVILVTDDVKEDWWLRVGGKTVGPLPALRNEFHEKAGVLFYMYSGDRFLEQARTSLQRPVHESTVAEVKKVREEQQEIAALTLEQMKDTLHKAYLAVANNPDHPVWSERKLIAPSNLADLWTSMSRRRRQHREGQLYFFLADSAMPSDTEASEPQASEPSDDPEHPPNKKPST